MSAGLTGPRPGCASWWPIASLARIFEPGSVAVVGASARPSSVGGAVVRKLVAGGFGGPIYPVNRSGEPVAGRRSFASVATVPGSVDLAVVAVPAEAVPGVVEECGAHGVRGLVVISGGFAEGRARQRELVATARRHGMRLIGPNCVGIVNTDPSVALDASFGVGRLTPGPVGLAAQSGAVGIAVLGALTESGQGVSTFASLGNKADVSGGDLLEWWEDDERTSVVLLYLESFGDPVAFAQRARRLARRKPVVAVKSGRTAAGLKAAGSHTAAMASDDAVVDALLRSCGVLRVASIDQLLDAALVLAAEPVAPGPRVAIVGNSGGPGIMAADASATAGLELADLAESTRAGLQALRPGGAVG
jgi:acetate---CoA ligase (ADP-forming)